MVYQVRQLEKYWAEIQQSLIETFSLTEQNKMNILEFIRHQKIWERRAKQRVENMKQKHGKR